MRWGWIAALGVISCGGPPRPERLPHGPKRTHRPEPVIAAPNSDRALDLQWEALGLDGDNYAARLETIPEDQRVRMASRLLRAGRFACEVLPRKPGQCERDQVQRLPSATSTIEDPCLRRLLALWALDQLDDEVTILGLHDQLTELILLPEPERALPAAAIAKMPSGFLKAGALWDAKTGGHAELIDTHLIEGLDHEDLRQAADAFHLDAAVLALDPTADQDVYVAAIEDSALLSSTRIEAMNRLIAVYAQLDGSQVSDVRVAILHASREHDCTVAAAASAALERVDVDGDFTLPGGPFRTERDVVVAACSMLGAEARGAPWKPLITRRGLQIVSKKEDPFRVDALWTRFPFAYDDDEDGVPDVPDADPDGDGDAATTEERGVKYWGKAFTLPYADELRLALPHCDDVDCAVPDSSVWFHLDIREERGTLLRLRGIERHERVGSDC